jgi:hypothetical protein
MTTVPTPRFMPRRNGSPDREAPSTIPCSGGHLLAVVPRGIVHEVRSVSHGTHHFISGQYRPRPLFRPNGV